MIYNMMVTEYLRRSVRVEAENEADAYRKVSELLSEECVVLTADDFVDRDIETMTKFTDGGIDTHDETYEVDDDFTKQEKAE